jgi:hypothetical protein
MKTLKSTFVALTVSAAVFVSLNAQANTGKEMDKLFADGKIERQMHGLVTNAMGSIMKSIDFNTLGKLMEKSMQQGMQDMAKGGLSAPAMQREERQVAEIITLPDGEEVVVIRRKPKAAAPAVPVDPEMAALSQKMEQSFQKEVAPQMQSLFLQLMPAMMSMMKSGMADMAKEFQDESKFKR